MAVKTFDLSSYLEERKSKIIIGEEEYEVSNGFNDLIKIDALAERREQLTTAEFIKEFLVVALGREGAEKLINKNYSTKLYLKIMDCIQSVYSDDDNDQEEASI